MLSCMRLGLGRVRCGGWLLGGLLIGSLGRGEGVELVYTACLADEGQQ